MTDDEIINAAKSAKTMKDAAAGLGLSFTTFARKAKRLGCYYPNQGSKGIHKPWLSERAIPLNEILDGKHPHVQSYKLKHKLYKESLKLNKCEICNIDEWNGKKIECELDHIDGNKTNHNLDNLRILCPNCHSQTDTFRFKRGRGENGKHKTLKMSTTVGSNPTVRTKTSN
jgi:5-methylcytosine-specific restriction endonuclease McrA